MRTQLTLFATAALSCLSFFTICAEAAKSANANDTCKLQLIPLKARVTGSTRFTLGDEIEIVLKFTSNNNATRVEIFHPGPVPGLSFEASTSDGTKAHNIDLTNLGGSGSYIDGALQPGKPLEYKVMLNDYVTFAKPGTYRVTATFRFCYSSSKRQDVVSEPLEIEVAKPDDGSSIKHSDGAKDSLKHLPTEKP